MVVYAVRLFNTPKNFNEYHLVREHTLLELLDKVNSEILAIAYLNGITDIQQIFVPLENTELPLSKFCPRLSYEAKALTKKI